MMDAALIARAYHAATGTDWWQGLADLTAQPRSELVSPVAERFGWRAQTPAGLKSAFHRLPFTEAQHWGVAPVLDAAGQLLVIVADPFDTVRLDAIASRLQTPCQWGLALPEAISAWLTQAEKAERAIDSAGLSFDADENGDTGEALSIASIAQDESPVVRLINATLYDGLKARASDIHLESTPQGLAVKYRIDGVLFHITAVNGKSTAEQAISRLKVLAELDIAEQRVPQDGRFRVHLGGRDIDFRVSIIPSLFGEDAVLRILDRGALAEQLQGLRLAALGFSPELIARFDALAAEPYGMVLVTGPTGSGKTTTLYAAISQVNTGEDKIITIEDPVEYQLPGIMQIPVNEKKGLTFARGLRAVLRHDPDKILVGEIRDPETAQIAVQAALTGHLVFTTVHANNVFDVLGRFMHMGVDNYSFVSALNGILAQRLVRQNCPHCTAPDQPDEELLRRSGLDPALASAYQFKAGRGCAECHGSGYLGRIAIGELLRLNDELRELILTRAPVIRLKSAATEAGWKSLRAAALEAVAQGKTTLTEINRVTFVD